MPSTAWTPIGVNPPAGVSLRLARQASGWRNSALGNVIVASTCRTLPSSPDRILCRNLVISMDKRGESAADSAQMAQELSALATRLKPRGMRIGYHNHAPEMAGAPGKTPWDVLAKNTPKDTILQQDVGWTTYAGKDPVALVRQYPGRTVSTHFKAKFVKGDSGTPIIGMDRTDWAGLTRAVRAVGGTEWIIIEQEEYPNGMGQLESVAASLRGLQTVIAKIAAK